MSNRTVTVDLSGILIIILIILCIGEPDILDGIIKWVHNAGECKP